MQIHCVESESEFLGLREEWESLREQSGSPSYFLSHDWFRCCWDELKSQNLMRVFVVRNGELPLLIAPLMLSRGSESKFPAKRLTFIEHPETQMTGILMLKDSSGEAALMSLFGYLKKQRSAEWNVMSLEKLPRDALVAGYLRKIADHATDHCQLETSQELLVLPRSCSWQEYLASQSPRFRKTLRNNVNRIQKLGRIEVNKYSGGCAATEAIHKLFSVADASWKLADGVGITSSSERMRFFEQLLERESTGQGAQIFILEVDGKPIASETQVIDGDVLFALRSDFDEGYADSSPGTFLQMEILQYFFNSSLSEYNFGVGLNPYKTRWAEMRRQLMRFRMYNETLYGRFLHTVNRCEPVLAKLPGARLLNNFISEKS